MISQLINKISLYLKVFDEKKKLAQSEKQFYDIAQSIGDGIYTVNLQHELTFINAQALEMLGFKASELIGKKIHNYIHYKDSKHQPISDSECEIHQTMLCPDRYSDDNSHLVKKDGSFLPVSIISTPLYQDSKVVGAVVIFHNKTKHNQIIELEEEKLKNQEQIIHSMVDMIESRDSYTAGHTKRVALYCKLIAQEMGYSSGEIALLEKAAWLHDIGKISTPDSVLLKPSKLDKREYFLIQDI